MAVVKEKEEVTDIFSQFRYAASEFGHKNIALRHTILYKILRRNKVNFTFVLSLSLPRNCVNFKVRMYTVPGGITGTLCHWAS